VRIVPQVRPLVAHIVRIPKDESLPVQHWAIDGLPRVLVNGRLKRQRKFFRTKEDAERELATTKKKLRKEGEKALLISDALRIEAIEAAELLKPLGVSLKEAVSFYVAHHQAASKSCTVEAAVTEYLKNQELKRRSERHIADLNYRLGVFKETFGTRLIRTLSVQEVEDWLHRLGQAPKSLNNFHTAVSALFSFAVKRSYATTNPFAAIDKVRVTARAPGILSPEECKKLLEAADSKILPLLAIQAFCGVRSAETLRLTWSDIDTTRGHVQVAAEHAKGARRRLVDIPDNLKDWLRPYADRTGKLWPRSHMEFYRDLDTARVSAGTSEWPSNALRHSYASYHLAYHQNAAALALQMGHTSQTMIFSNYREVVTRQEAERYWNIRPKSVADNVIQMEAAAS
jgi:integrase